MKVRTKILLSVALAAVVTALTVMSVSLANTFSVTSKSEKEYIKVANITLQAYMKDLESGAKRAVLMTSHEEDVIDGLAEFLKTGNRQNVENALSRAANYSDLDFLAVTDTAGKVVARSDRPFEFGGDYSVFASVRAAMGGKEGAGYEPGDGVPMALRHGAPVARDGKIIGVVSGGYDLSLSKFVDKMKDYLCAEVTVFTGDERVATTVTDGQGKRNIGTKADGAVYRKVLAGEDYMGAEIVAGKDFYTCYAPIRDAAGKGLGMTFVGMDVTATKRQIAVSIAIMVAIVAVFSAIAVLIGLYIAGGIAKPLGATVKMIEEMGRGHLGMRLRLERSDEIGVMAKTLDRFADDLQNTVIGTMKKISAGDLSAKIESKDDKDEISDTLRKTVSSLRVVIGTMKKISGGDLSTKIESKGDADEVSNTLKKTVEALNAVVGTMKKISEGDLSSDIEPQSEKDVISTALKATVESLRALIIDDGGRVLQAAAGKDLSQRLTGEYRGEFARMKDNINTVMRSLDAALTQVSEAVSKVAEASGGMSEGAQSLAEGSNEQASSLEEVSASLEEMSSMTKQNADTSNQAAVLASEARAAAGDGDASVRRMADAINKIKQSSDNTAKIVRSINDIAFQTNLLALNAAVEAARAGEAGKGFAVVAEEVRNLAMRSAEAAKDTADMIDESARNAGDGVKITEEVAGSLSQILNRTVKVGDLIAEIAAASKEQAQGIEQVNAAVAQMNDVTQRNASNAEESAGAAEELSGQAAELAVLVGGFKLSAGTPVSANIHTPQKRQHTGRHNTKRETHPPQITSQGAANAGKTVRPEEVFPLDDDEINEMLNGTGA
jgi:methyl-accepting chemotaxis protein